jgi:plastocyanin
MHLLKATALAGLLGTGAFFLLGLSSAVVDGDEAADCCTTKSTTLWRANYLSVPPAQEGEVRGAAHGRVVFVGEIPEREEHSITEAQAKGCTDEGSKVAADVRSLLIGEDRGIANAVVSIWLPEDELIVPEEPVVLDQVQCRFSQPVTIIPAGATVEYRNSDRVPHNVHVYSIKNKPYNTTLPAGASQKQVLDQAETLQIKCDIHPWMKAYVFVSSTNYAALTDEHGAFEIPGLPAGTYTLRVWHEKLGKSELQVTVAAEDAGQALEIELKAPEKKSRRRR